MHDVESAGELRDASPGRPYGQLRSEDRVGSLAAASSSSSHSVVSCPIAPAAGTETGCGATDGGGHRVGLAAAGDHQPDLAGTLNGGQRQGDSLRRRLGGVVDRTTMRVVSRTAGVSGNSELMWPSGPMPSRWTSKFGTGSPGAALAASTCS